MSSEFMIVVEKEEDKATERCREECEVTELGLVSKDTLGWAFYGPDGGIGFHF